MRWLEVWLTGLLPGIGLGWFLKRVFSKPDKKNCRFVDKQGGKFQGCPVLPSPTCMEHLCPTHCAELHGKRCFDLQYKGA